MSEELVRALSELGLTQNEALAYLALLDDPAGDGLTGYEIAARSGMPRSAVYAVLRRLESRGAAFSLGNEPARYAAISPDRLIATERGAAKARLDAAEAALAAMPRHPRREPVHLLGAYDEVMAAAAGMIRGGERSVWLSAWPREIDQLRAALSDTNAALRVLHSPAALPDPPPRFSTWIDGAPGKGGWSHKLILVVDRSEALLGGSEPGVDNQAVRTRNPSLVDLATNHLVLDITLLARSQGRDPVHDVAPMMRPHLSKGG